MLGLVIGIRWRTAGRVITATGIAALYLLSTPLVAGWLIDAMNDADRLEHAAAQRAEAIVVLGAGMSSDMTAPNGVTLGRLTSERLRYAAHCPNCCNCHSQLAAEPEEVKQLS